MSKEMRFFSITPERMSPGGRMESSFESIGHPCSYCQANGYFWQEDQWRERYKANCPICKGCGKLDAQITIKWHASKEK